MHLYGDSVGPRRPRQRGIGSSKGVLLCDLEVPRIDLRSFPHDRQTKSMSHIMKKKTDLRQARKSSYAAVVYHIRYTGSCLLDFDQTDSLSESDSSMESLCDVWIA